MSNKSIILTHQGWTDIVNSIPLINYYSKIRENVIFVVRDDALEMMNYYTKHLDNVEVHGMDKTFLNGSGEYVVRNFPNCEYLFFGGHDTLSTNPDRRHKFHNSEGIECFVQRFYKPYGLDYSIRVNEFEISRDMNLENELYEKFVSEHGENYTLNHKVGGHVEGCKSVELDGISNRFFDVIKIMENAKEMYLLDSVWAAIVYMLDGKYRLFKDKKIFVKCERGYIPMFTEPIKLDNWTVTY